MLKCTRLIILKNFFSVDNIATVVSVDKHLFINFLLLSCSFPDVGFGWGEVSS